VRRRGGTAALACAAALVAAAPAQATETRAEYAAQVNPICVQATAETEAIEAVLERKLKKFEEARKPNFKALLRSMTRLNRQIEAVEEGRETAIAAVPPAPGDELLVQIWLANRDKRGVVQDRVAKKAIRLLIVIFSALDPKNPESSKLPRKAKRLVVKIDRLVKEEKRLTAAEKAQATTLGVPACILPGAKDQSFFAASRPSFP
jgi:hypothetical protein